MNSTTWTKAQAPSHSCFPNSDTDVYHTLRTLKATGEETGRSSHLCVVANLQDECGAPFFPNGISCSWQSKTDGLRVSPSYPAHGWTVGRGALHMGEQCPCPSLSQRYHALEPVKHKHYKLNPASVWPYATNYKVEWLGKTGTAAQSATVYMPEIYAL